MKPSRGLFVTLEGGEGAGKSSVGRRLQRMLEADGREVLFTREPGGTPLGEAIRDRLLAHTGEPMEAEAETLLFLAARAQHLASVIRPSLAAGKIVLCDRFNDSTIAYQGYGRGLNIERLSTLCHFVTQGTEPDLTFLFDIDPMIGLERAGRTAAHDRLEAEALSFHHRVRKGFFDLAHQRPNHVKIIDGSAPLDEVVMQVYGELKWNPSSETPYPNGS